jgi:xanthine/uracil permease
MEASRMVTNNEDAALRIKGALFNDGISGFISALATSLPLTTFAQARLHPWACSHGVAHTYTVYVR